MNPLSPVYGPAIAPLPVVDEPDLKSISKENIQFFLPILFSDGLAN